ncbi:hypothetical protein BPAE_0104g00170 [Botrytis paeoniae]|uniref:Uncharacterized protein n=1 Tax=Botrytis paeoniae TaxID=278948 RepID=A0A4Z1FRR5_9HELO|nr:hypothetical protein BPAE_0104g00170 [Botrytis paeoniae]
MARLFNALFISRQHRLNDGISQSQNIPSTGSSWIGPDALMPTPNKLVVLRKQDAPFSITLSASAFDIDK